MNRRDILKRLGLVLIAVPVAASCAAEEPYPPMPPGGGGGGEGGGGGGGGEEDASFMVSNNDYSGHTHSFEVLCSELEDGKTVWTAGGAHTHQVTLSDAQLATILDGQSVTVESTGGHPHTWVIQMPSGRCG